MARTLKDYPWVSLNPEDLAVEIDFRQVFGRHGPVHIEVGTGKGTFLVNEAKARPEVDFLGIEWARKYHRYAVDRIGRWGLTNVRIIRTDAAYFVGEFVPDDSVDCFHIYFPDPWPKKRHHKRRFVSAANLEQLLRCLKTGGELRIATDHAEYSEVIEQLMAQRTERLELTEFGPTAGAEAGELTGTNYERKYINDLRQIHNIAARKK